MQTTFSAEQLQDPALAESEKILRACVHCGFCTATCPTYVTLGDELDSPRGRIYLIKDMLEQGKPAPATTVKHVDRCLSCLSCMTTCPSGVHYMHLVDHARNYIEETYQRPVGERFIRFMLRLVMPHPGRFRLALMAAKLGRPFAPLFGKFGTFGRRIAAVLELAPRKPLAKPQLLPGKAFNADNASKRVALLTGCVQPVLDENINAATVELLNNLGISVVLPKGEGCCGSLVHHMGREQEALEAARRNIDAWWAELTGEGLDAIIITASGCGTTIKDYWFMLRNDPEYAEKAAKISALAQDVTEYLSAQNLADRARTGLVVAYHAACSMQHGQKITEAPKKLLRTAGFEVREIGEAHLCCGSAGTYNMMQPELARQLRDRKLTNIERTAPDLIASGNIGCLTQLSGGTDIPVIHTVELLNWAYGGREPQALPAPPQPEQVPAA